MLLVYCLRHAVNCSEGQELEVEFMHHVGSPCTSPNPGCIYLRGRGITVKLSKFDRYKPIANTFTTKHYVG